MNRNSMRPLAALICAGLMLIRCSTAPTMAGGSGSSTTNGFSAAVLNANGSLAKGALVKIRPADFLAGSAVDTSQKSILDTIADDSGAFFVKNLKPGDYTIEIAGDSSQGALLKARIERDDSTRHLGAVSLSPTGSIQGQVEKTSIGDTVQLTVRFYGLDRKIACLADGRFTAEKIPASLYTLQVSASLPEVGILNVPMVSVNSGAPTILSPVSMPIEYLHDSVAVRAFLTAMNLTSVNWNSVVSISGNRIRTLDLHGLGLTDLDSSIGSLNFLYTLYLGGNRFSALPSSLKRLGVLSHIGFQGGPLDSLFNVITELTGLSALTLSGTGCKTLPASMANMTSLHGLFIDSCGLDSIPAVIYSIPTLTELNVGKNSLTTLSPLIGNLNNLEQLWVNDNRISALPDEIGNLIHLQNLWAYRNRIAACPATISQLNGSLRILQIESNALITLPASITGLQSLSDLVVKGNSLCTLPAPIEQWIIGILGTDWRTTQPQTGCP